MIATGITAVSLVLATFAPFALIPIVLVLAYASVSMGNGPFWALVSQLVDSSIAAELTGEVTLIANIAGIIVAPILSMIVDATGSGLIPLVICVIFSALCVISARIIKK